MNIQTKPSVKLIEINAEQSGQRIDNFLLRILKGVPKSKIYQVLRRGEVRVNRGRIKPDYLLKVGDTVRVPPLRIAERDRINTPAGWLQRLHQAVLHEDDDVLVVDKPSGLAVHKGSGLDYGLIEALRELRPEEKYLELAHRLDRETSGCLLLAKTPLALREVQAALNANLIDKRYLTLVRGQWKLGTREVILPLRKNTLRSGERMVVVADDGKPARTRFTPLDLNRSASLIEAKIFTGRTHQIRVHAAAINYPIAGDSKYGDAEFNRRLSSLGLNRLFLHAHTMTIRIRGREIVVSSALPRELSALLDRLN